MYILILIDGCVIFFNMFFVQEIVNLTPRDFSTEDRLPLLIVYVYGTLFFSGKALPPDGEYLLLCGDITCQSSPSQER